jgi:hypothetical protein
MLREDRRSDVMSRWFGTLIGGKRDGEEVEIVGTEHALSFLDRDGEWSSKLDYVYTGYSKRETRGVEIVMIRAYVAPGIKWHRPSEPGHVL